MTATKRAKKKKKKTTTKKTQAAKAKAKARTKARAKARAKAAKPSCKRIDDWKKAAKDRFVLALVEAYRAYKTAKNAGERAIAQCMLPVRQRFGDAMAVKIAKGYLEVRCDRARQIVASTYLWERQADEVLWNAVGRAGVTRIDAVRPAKAQNKLKKLVMAMSATNDEQAGTKIVSPDYIDKKIEQLGLKTVAPPQPKTKRGPKTKTQTVLTLDAATDALRETHALLARTPALEGCFSIEALETIKKVQ